MIDVAVWLLCLGTALPVLVLAMECLAGAPGPRKRDGVHDAPPFVVLMPAHNEAAGIRATARAVVGQLRACDRLVVIADNCTDDTATLAAREGATVVVREDPERRGKGCALEFGRAYLEPDSAQMVIVVDADCRPGPDALCQLAGTAARRQAVVQGAYLLLPGPNANAIVRVSCFAFLVKNLVRQLALRRLAGAALLQGSGMAFPAAIFRRVQWSTDSLVEDLEIGIRLLIEGESVIFDDAAQFFSDASSPQGTISQRRRWEHGTLESMFRFAPRLMRAGLHGKAGLLVVALDMLVPPTVLLLLTAIFAAAVAIALTGFTAPLFLLLAALLTLATGLGVAWRAHGRAILPARSLLRVFGYMIWKAPIVAQFVTRRQRAWQRTEREP